MGLGAVRLARKSRCGIILFERGGGWRERWLLGVRGVEGIGDIFLIEPIKIVRALLQIL